MIRGVTAHDESSHTPIDQALDLLVYLPIGFVFELPRSIPRFIERGRRELHANSRLTETSNLLDPRYRLDRAQAHAVSTLRALGVLSQSEPPEPPPPPASEAEQGVDTAPVSAPVGAPLEAVDPDSLAIPGYESLSASQVMPRLESLSPTEREQVRTYEQAHRARKTILNKIAQLQRAE
jgi:hypothetical protein